ncbi:hypothetical protein R9C00_03335 [Flammeovirgaceae bacterium SG7u.111]|nr:hypothetical protein [Flammeovirgaceae bacterium SG7u.132]WPO36476.1 hypothetical protein R9C00_03335 [Flammeovirgaceae bacterium SG7u.111]
MAFSITYKRLFEVKVLHDYYLNQGETPFDELDPAILDAKMAAYSLDKELLFYPEKATSRYVFRQTPVGFFIALKVEPRETIPVTYQPFSPLGGHQKITVLAALKNPVFNNFTNLPIHQEANTIYYFSNLAGGTGSSFPTLTKPFAKLESGKTYFPGDLVASADGSKLYEATTTTKRGLGTADWEKRPLKPYVSAADKVTLVNSAISHTLTTAGVQKLTLSVLDLNVDEAGKQLVYEEKWEENQDLQTVQANLQSLPIGYYQFKFEGESGYLHEFSAYLWTKSEKPPFAIIELFHKAGLGDYALLDDAENTLTMPSFEIRLKNRASFWRYFFTKDITLPADADLEEEASSNRQAITKKAKHLTSSYNTLTLEQDGEEVSLPNPSAAQLRPERDAGNPDKIKVVSEVYL